MPILTLIIGGNPVAEHEFDMPERDKLASASANKVINANYIRVLTESLKNNNIKRINEAGGEYEIHFSLKSGVKIQGENGTDSEKVDLLAPEEN